MYRTKLEEDYIVRNLTYVKEKLPVEVGAVRYEQLNLIDMVKDTELTYREVQKVDTKVLYG